MKPFKDNPDLLNPQMQGVERAGVDSMQKQFYHLGARAQSASTSFSLLCRELPANKYRLPRKLKKKLRRHRQPI